MMAYHMRLKYYSGAVAYTMRFLALQTIGQHPDVYGLDVKPAQTDAYRNHLKNPYSKLPPEIAL